MPFYIRDDKFHDEREKVYQPLNSGLFCVIFFVSFVAAQWNTLDDSGYMDLDPFFFSSQRKVMQDVV